MTFTEEQQQEHRLAFVNECRQKAWGAAAHADWISKGLDEIMEQYAKLKNEDDGLAADIKEDEAAGDYHTVENRQKRKEMQERRNHLVQLMQALGQSVGQGQKAMEQLLQSVESNLSLAKHVEGWSWKEEPPKA
jgi:hypothetical protein